MPSHTSLREVWTPFLGLTPKHAALRMAVFIPDRYCVAAVGGPCC